jgi:MoaA/NifB/PqqE/SkfB family radical SAM enzyme
MLEELKVEMGKNLPKKKTNVKEIASTTVRMLEHIDRFPEIKKGKIRPITIHLAPTDSCNLECEWCSTAKRGKNVLKFNEVKGIIDTYVDLGIKSLEITGGGDPTVYPYLADTIHYAKDEKNIDVGMITNGLLLDRVEETALKKLTWLRISLSGLEFNQDSDYFNLDVERFPEFVGTSFVFTTKTLQNSFLSRVNKVADYLKAKYIRVVPNCYNVNDIQWTKQIAPKLIEQFPKMMLQVKDNTTPPKCYWKYIKPFVNADGYVYQCSTNSLFKGYFSEDWRVCHWTEVKEIYEKQIFSFDTSKCPYCFFTNQNQLIQDLMIDVKHKNFF